MRQNTKRFLAPNMKEQPSNATECKIYIGSQAWDFAKAPKMDRSKEEINLDEILPAGEDVPPIVLDVKILANLTAYQIAPPTVRYIGIYRANKAKALPDDVLSVLCFLIAEQTQAKIVILFDEAGRQIENLSEYINRLRTDEEAKERASLVAEASKPDEQRKAEFVEAFSHLSPYEQLQSFTKWFDKPIRYHKQLKTVYQYTGKKWEMIEPDDFGSHILNYMISNGFTKFSASKIDNIKDMAKYAYLPLEKCHSDLLGFSNGILNKRTGEFISHHEEHFLTSFINIDYYSTATPTPNFDKWLNCVSNNKVEKRQRILAALYMILTNRYEWQLFLEITGAGGTGKSIFNYLAQILAGGEENTTSMSLKDLEDPVIRCDLFDKTLCYSPDQESYISDGGVLRSITGGDMILFNPKYIKPFKDYVKAVFLITGNSPIIFKEQKGGTSRRRVIFQFNKVVTEDEKDYHLKEKLEQEAGGIVRLLLDTFPDPMEAKKLLEEQKTSEEALEVKEENDHILQFAKHFEARGLINGLTLGSSRKPNAHRTALHSAYIYYCECMGINNPLQRNRFRQAFEYALKERNSPHPLKTRTKGGINITNIYYINMSDSLNDWDN